MNSSIHSQTSGIDSLLEAKEENLDMKKLEKEFQEGLGTVFAEIKDVELRTNKEISSMSTEEFFSELENLDNQYEAKIKIIVDKQIKKETEAKKEVLRKEQARKELLEIELKNSDEEKKLAAQHEDRLKAIQEKFKVEERENKIEVSKNKVDSLSLTLKNYAVDSFDYQQTLSALVNAKKNLEALLG